MLQYTTHSLNPAKLFFSNEPLDYAVCYVDGEPGAVRGFADIRSPGSLVTDTRINIIQHPGGELKKIAIRNNGLKYFDEQKLQYWTDTEHGSSGSPLFNDSWQIVGLHHLNDAATDAAGERDSLQCWNPRGRRIWRVFRPTVYQSTNRLVFAYVVGSAMPSLGPFSSAYKDARIRTPFDENFASSYGTSSPPIGT